MIAQFDHPQMSPQDYLAWEIKQTSRYGYMDGQVYAMTGGTIPHNQIAVNLVALIHPHLRGKQCKTLSSDAKIGVTEQGPFHYPDVSVTCDPRDRNARDFIRYPCLIVEVLSSSTEAFDRGQKFRHYRRIETLQEYILIDPEQISVECYRLNANNRWELFHYTSDANPSENSQVNLTSIDLTFPIELLYEDIDLINNE
jgi:Uma2 family endonuclease